MSNNNTPTISYLFDPLCGWCYGASPVLQRLAEQPGIRLELAPTGLFAGSGARAMDTSFAEYAWSNDQRIEKLTGQRFSETYRTQLLSRPGGRFDSGATTLALSAVALTAPEQELATLKRLQEARYVQGLDTGEMTVVERLLREAGLDAAADLLTADDAALQATHQARIAKAKGQMQALGAQGVPALVLTTKPGHSQLVRGNALYGSFEHLLAQLGAA